MGTGTGAGATSRPAGRAGQSHSAGGSGGTGGSGHHGPQRDAEQAGGTSSAILAAVASGVATDRATLARRLGLAPSTVTVKVGELIAAGVLAEAGAASATGGRPARVLRLTPGGGCILAAELGRHHARIALLDMSGALVRSADLALDVAAGPEPVLEELVTAWTELRGAIPADAVRAVGVALPGPVSSRSGAVDSPAAMPGWHRFPVGAHLSQRLGLPAVVENDANAMALGECTALATAPPAAEADGTAGAGAPATGGPANLLFVKAGSSVGCGLVLDGRLYRGATALAGDLAHVVVGATGDAPCNCGNRGCLDTVVGGSYILADLRARGIEAHQPLDIARLVGDGDAQATTRVRAAGRLLGQTLSAVVNFVNPDAVVLGGLLSTLEPFVAAVRSQLYENCHPLATRDLRIEQSAAGADAGVLGVGQLALRQAIVAL
ncbi:ROK family transcriptional regulator [Quadrisphaera sp. INWT6]|uniref:ROK family transcriptional regulator n=1 Tax=Quadrisphaera sp. INWT6 TaxID=2596917 RepID=UPI0018926451|nr:ROK family protein [Quadrisphaera sp. INWT6]MBF5080257.1 ROK family protein [Quadrisphaera sp. INWT6]